MSDPNIHKILAEEFGEQARERPNHNSPTHHGGQVQVYESRTPPHMPIDITSWNVSGTYDDKKANIWISYSISIGRDGISVTTGYDEYRDFYFDDPNLFDNVWHWIEYETPRIQACKAKGVNKEAASPKLIEIVMKYHWKKWATGE